MTDQEIHNIYLHMSGKAEGLVESTGKADFPVMFAKAIREYERLTKDAQNMASKSTYKEQLETKEYERGFIDGMQRQMQSSVDKAVNSMGKREWVDLTKEEIDQGLLRSFYVLQKARAWRDGVAWAEEILKEKNT
jgi:hypothetical protein